MEFSYNCSFILMFQFKLDDTERVTLTNLTQSLSLVLAQEMHFDLKGSEDAYKKYYPPLAVDISAFIVDDYFKLKDTVQKGTVYPRGIYRKLLEDCLDHIDELVEMRNNCHAN